MFFPTLLFSSTFHLAPCFAKAKKHSANNLPKEPPHSNSYLSTSRQFANSLPSHFLPLLLNIIMATTDSNPAASADDSQLSKSAENKEKVSKVDKPDEEKYKRDISDAEKQLSAIQEKMVLKTFHFTKPH